MERTVIYVTGQDPTKGKGGGSSYVRAHARAALRENFDTHIFCLSDRDETVSTEFGIVHRVATSIRLRGPVAVHPEEHPEKYFLHWIGSLIHTSNMTPLHAGVLTRSISKFIMTQPGSCLVHAFGSWGNVGLKVRKYLKEREVKIPVVCSFFTTAVHETKGKLVGAKRYGSLRHRSLYSLELLWAFLVTSRLEKRVVNKSSLVIVNYRSVRQLLFEEHGCVADIRILPFSPESVILHPSRQPPRPGCFPEDTNKIIQAPLIVTVSRHDPRKGLETLLRSFATLKQRGVAFRAQLASGGPLFNDHMQLLEILDLGVEVKLLGWVEDPLKLMDQADIFVLPSLEEGSGSLSMLEAMQCSLAIVASDIDGISEDLTHDSDGLLVEPGNVDALSDALEKLLTDADLRQKLSRGANQRFLQDFSTESFSSALREIYGELWESPANT